MVDADVLDPLEVGASTAQPGDRLTDPAVENLVAGASMDGILPSIWWRGPRDPPGFFAEPPRRSPKNPS